MQDKDKTGHPPIDNKQTFDRNLAFSRTIGLVTQNELEILKNKTVAIAGLGGVGGSHALVLARLGVGSLHIADFDHFSIENFNRQVGATMDSINRPKIRVMEDMLKSINPELKIKTFSEGVNKSNIDSFLVGVDAFLDGLDFFAFDARKMVFESCYKKSIPATTVGPIGMGAALINFIPGKMKFNDYFNWSEDDSHLELAIKFLIGLSPKVPHRHYIVDSSAVNLKEKRGPSTPMACELSAGVAGSEILKILLNRKGVRHAPQSIVYDAYLNKLFHSCMWFGNRNPIQQLKIAYATWALRK